MVQCPQCMGEKTITVTVFTSGSGNSEGEAVRLTCTTCRGVGSVSRETAEAVELWDSMQCRCTTRSGTTCYADGEGVIDKHHWCCNDCDGIVQVG